MRRSGLRKQRRAFFEQLLGGLEVRVGLRAIEVRRRQQRLDAYDGVLNPLGELDGPDISRTSLTPDIFATSRKRTFQMISKCLTKRVQSLRGLRRWTHRVQRRYEFRGKSARIDAV